MIQGLYTAANGMISVEERQGVIANNIANASTHGFKRQMAVQKGYYGEYMGQVHPPQSKAPGGGVKMIETFSNFSGGGVTKTGGELDVALMGKGFFTIQMGDEALYTRNGQFSVDPAGMLSTPAGYSVLDEGGAPIDVSGGLIAIDDVGNVRVNGEVRAKLGITQFEDPHGLKRVGDNVFQATEDMVANSTMAANPKIASQSLETSNVQVPTEMINMMMALRAYSANQKAIASIDETVSKMIDHVGSPG